MSTNHTPRTCWNFGEDKATPIDCVEENQKSEARCLWIVDLVIALASPRLWVILARKCGACVYWNDYCIAWSTISTFACACRWRGTQQSSPLFRVV
eukprot:c21599_g1_i1 orf=1198-1485(-)